MSRGTVQTGRTNQWWQNYQLDPTLNRSQVDQMGIQSQEKVATSELDFMKEKYNNMLAMWEGMFGGDGGAGEAFNVPKEFAKNINLFQPGGQFGEGGKAEIVRGGNQALAAGQIGLSKTGMSSGTNVAGLGARVAADTALGLKQIEDQRVGLLSGALTQAGGAAQTSQQLKAQREAELMRSLSMFG